MGSISCRRHGMNGLLPMLPKGVISKSCSGRWKTMLLESRIVWDYAAMEGHLHVLQWAKIIKARWFPGYNIGYMAAEKGHFKILKWMAEEGMALGVGVCRGAAKGGHLQILQWLWEQGEPLDDDVCCSAAENGHLEVLKWARINEAKWDTRVCAEAAYENAISELYSGLEIMELSGTRRLVLAQQGVGI